MNLILGVDQTGVVRLVGSGGDASTMPSEWNGLTLMVYVLTDEQEQAYAALPADRGHTTFDGVEFVAVPAVAQDSSSAGEISEQRGRILSALAADDPTAAKIVEVLKTAGLL